MILLTQKAEAAALVLHMSGMRADFRNLLKRKYKQQKEQYLECYDYVKEMCHIQIDLDLEFKAQHLNIIDVKILHEFLSSYLDKLDQELQKAKQQEDESIFYLRTVKKRCKELLDDVA